MSDVGSFTANPMVGDPAPFSDVGSVEQFAVTPFTSTQAPTVVGLDGPAPAVAGFTVAQKLSGMSSQDKLILGIGVAAALALLLIPPQQGRAS